jgi:hypothetical protein
VIDCAKTLNMSKQDRLSENQFEYKATKDGKLFVFWKGRHVRSYAGTEAADILAEIEAAGSVTGNFKRGNEKLAKNKREWD